MKQLFVIATANKVFETDAEGVHPLRGLYSMGAARFYIEL